MQVLGTKKKSIITVIYGEYGPSIVLYTTTIQYTLILNGNKQGVAHWHVGPDAPKTANSYYSVKRLRITIPCLKVISRWLVCESRKGGDKTKCQIYTKLETF